MELLRIVHLIDYYGTKAKFQEHYLPQVQSQEGHDVAIITSNRPPKSLRTVEGVDRYPTGVSTENGVRVIRLSAVANLHGSATILWGLLDELQKIKPDVVHAHGLAYRITTPYAALLKNYMGFRLIIGLHAAAYNTHPYSTPLKVVYHNIHRYTVGRFAVNAADCLVAVGEAEKEFCCAQFGVDADRVVVVPLGVETQIFFPDTEKRKETRLMLGLNDEDVAIIHSGKISHRKDLHVLIEAMSQLVAQDIPLKILLVGHKEDSRYCRWLEEKAHQKAVPLTWVGFQNELGLADLFRAADIAAWPGDPSISILEAMASGLPLVLARGAAHPGMLANQNGISFPRGDVDRLAGELKSIVINKCLREAMERRSRELAVKCFDWTRINDQFMSLYRSGQV